MVTLISLSTQFTYKPSLRNSYFTRVHLRAFSLANHIFLVYLTSIESLSLGEYHIRVAKRPPDQV